MNLPQIDVESKDDEPAFKILTSNNQNDEIDQMVLNFIEKHGVPGLSLTYGNEANPKMLQRNYGYARSSNV